MDQNTDNNTESLKTIADALNEIYKAIDKQNTLLRELVRTVNQLRFK